MHMAFLFVIYLVIFIFLFLYFSLVAIPPLICLSLLFLSRTSLTLLARLGFTLASLSETSLCVVVTIWNCFFLCRCWNRVWWRFRCHHAWLLSIWFRLVPSDQSDANKCLHFHPYPLLFF